MGPAGSEFEGERDELERDVEKLVAQAFPVSEAAVQAARDALGTRGCSSTVLSLAHDSLEPREGGSAATDRARLLLFRGHGIAVEMRVTATGDRCELVGRVRPPHPCSASVVAGDQRIALHDDGDGSFRGRRIPRRPSTVLLRIPAGGLRRRYRTEWTAF